MLDPDELSRALHSLLTGFPDRARNLISTSTSLDEDERKLLWDAVSNTSDDPGVVVEALGDALRMAHADKALVNETYRAAFYGSRAWLDLLDDPLFAFFSANRAGLVLDKWIHYFPIYTRHLTPYVGRLVSVLEIGVYRGGSMRMWSKFFGPQVHLVGVDIDPVALISAEQYTVVLADQADPEAIRKVALDHGPFDVIIDDGGHSMTQQIASIETLFPLLNEGGVYLVEDCHTSYWDEYDGGRDREGTFMEWVKTHLDDLNGYHQEEEFDPVWTKQVDGIHVYDSVVVVDKKTRFAPFAEQNGGADFVFNSRIHAVIASELVATRQAALEERDRALEGPMGLDAVRDELRIARGELSKMPRLALVEAELADTRAHVREMRKTLSWRVTAPLRRLRRWG